METTTSIPYISSYRDVIEVIKSEGTCHELFTLRRSRADSSKLEKMDDFDRTELTALRDMLTKILA